MWTFSFFIWVEHGRLKNGWIQDDDDYDDDDDDNDDDNGDDDDNDNDNDDDYDDDDYNEDDDDDDPILDVLHRERGGLGRQHCQQSQDQHLD